MKKIIDLIDTLLIIVLFIVVYLQQLEITDNRNAIRFHNMTIGVYNDILTKLVAESSFSISDIGE